MKKQNPQDILNEILLRMNYDSKKTLSENKKIIFEQLGEQYYTSWGSKTNNPTGAKASEIFSNGIYPEKINPGTKEWDKLQQRLS